MRMKKVVVICVCLFLCFLAATSLAKKPEECWRLDAPAADGLPKNFRIYLQEGPCAEQDRAAGRPAYIGGWSASGQPAEGEIAPIYSYLLSVTKDIQHVVPMKIYIVDLREEAHAFVNGNAVSKYRRGNQANKGRAKEKILYDEEATFYNLLGTDIEAIPLGKNDTKKFSPFVGRVISVSTEREAAEKAGFIYVRFMATDEEWPRPEIVDEFLDFLRENCANGQGELMHFHCQAGHGRTTSFTMMYDILRLGSKETLEEMAAMHYEMGGTDLLATREGDGIKAQRVNDRAEKIRLFYEFAKEENPLYSDRKWSDWLREKGL